jgi:microcystin-dependent protein
VYGLRYRGSLEPTTQAEFEGLVAALQEFLLTEHNEDGTHRAQTNTLAPVPIGGVVQWMTGTPPEGWLLCDGRPVARTTYARLFSVIGTTYGTGDGALTFNLPDLRGRFFLGQSSTGTGSTIGETGGSLDHTHGATVDAGGAHTHTVSGMTDENVSATPVDANFDAATVNVATDDHLHDVSLTTSSDGSHTHTGSIDGNNPPFLVGTFIILAGV